MSSEPGKAVVLAETGVEVVREAFDMSSFLADLKAPAHMAQQKALAAAYDAACDAIIGANDVQREGARTFKKKSAWRKLARYFHISTGLVTIERETLPNGHFLATVTARATAPWGQYMEAVGACCTDEATGRRVISTADAIATAETRATNRAVSNLIAMGEVSAEELGDPKSYDAPRQARSGGDRLMPFGKHKGTPIKDLDSDVLAQTLAWCREKDAKKFAELIGALEQELSDRHDGAGLSPALEDEPDSLPF